MTRLEMKNYNMILTEKLQISAPSSGKIDKYECLTGEEILPSARKKLTLGKALEKKQKRLKIKDKKNKIT